MLLDIVGTADTFDYALRITHYALVYAHYEFLLLRINKPLFELSAAKCIRVWSKFKNHFFPITVLFRMIKSRTLSLPFPSISAISGSASFFDLFARYL